MEEKWGKMHRQGELRQEFWLEEWNKGRRMVKIKLILCDDEGNQLAGVEAKDYAIAVGNETLDEIEAAVEDFNLKALSELEYELLSVAQERLSQQIKKRTRSQERKNSSHH